MQPRILRQSAKRRRKRWDLPSTMMVAFMAVWIVGIYYIGAYVDSPPSDTTSTRSGNAENAENAVAQRITTEKRRQALSIATHKDPQNIQSNNNPWYGWQPDYYNSNNHDGCSVRDCFKQKGTFDDHPQCPYTCRDNPKDFDDEMAVPPENWVPDATMLHRMLLDGKDQRGNPWPPSLSHDYCQDIGVFGGSIDDNKKLLDGVPIRGMPLDSRGPTIFCGVYTMQQNHAGSIRAMRETWAPHCDGFVAFSTASDPRIPALAIEHEGPEEYDNMWQKSRAIWQYIGGHYLKDFDYFILGGDDLLVIPNNLRLYLKSLNQSPDDDLFAGRRFKGYGKDNYFNSGGAGYVLSRGTLRKFYEVGYDHPECNAHRHTAMEDVMIAECLRKVLNVGLTDTRDDQGRERFHPFAPGNHLDWKFPEPGQHDWYADYNKEWGLKLGLDCCAPDSVSFHYIKKSGQCTTPMEPTVYVPTAMITINNILCTNNSATFFNRLRGNPDYLLCHEGFLNFAL